MVYRNSTTTLKPRYQIYVIKSLLDFTIKNEKTNDYWQRAQNTATHVKFQLLKLRQPLLHLNHLCNCVASQHAHCVAHIPVAILILHAREKHSVSLHRHKHAISFVDAVTLDLCNINTIHAHRLHRHNSCRCAAIDKNCQDNKRKQPTHKFR